MLALSFVRLVPVRVVPRRRFGRVSEPELFPGAPGAGKPVPLPVLDTRVRDAVFYEQPVGSIINPPESTGMGYWSINPYVGCEFGCTYCYARFTHRYTVERAEQTGKLDSGAMGPYQGADAWQAFEHRIFVKQHEAVVEALDRDLLRVRKRRGAGEETEIVIGTATDPYQPAERIYRTTRSILERLARERGIAVGIISKSPLICRDIDVLSDIQQHNALTLPVSLITTDGDLVRRLEARSPMPHARLRGLHRLTQARLNAGVIMAPVLPGINDGTDAIRSLVTAAKAAGARFAFPSALRLYPSIRDHFLPIFEQHFPALAPKYRSAYAGAGHAPRKYAQALQRRFSRVAAEAGVPMRHHFSPARETTSAPAGAHQLALWRNQS